jgi:hypothetical protein
MRLCRTQRSGLPSSTGSTISTASQGQRPPRPLSHFIPRRRAPAISVSTNPGLVDKLSVPVSTRTVISRISTGWIIADAVHVLRKAYRPGCTADRAVIPSDHYTSERLLVAGGDVNLTPKSATEVRAVRGRMTVRVRRLEPFWASSKSTKCTSSSRAPRTRRGRRRGVRRSPGVARWQGALRRSGCPPGRRRCKAVAASRVRSPSAGWPDRRQALGMVGRRNRTPNPK